MVMVIYNEEEEKAVFLNDFTSMDIFFDNDDEDCSICVNGVNSCNTIITGITHDAAKDVLGKIVEWCIDGVKGIKIKRIGDDIRLERMRSKL